MLSKFKKGREGKIVEISKRSGILMNVLFLAGGIYFNYIANLDFVVRLGDKGSIASTLLKSFAISSGRSLFYLSIYGLLLTFFSKKESLKEFYTYYMIAVCIVGLGSLIYFIA